MDADLASALLDQSGVVLLAVLIVWRLDRRLERLIERLDKLVEAVRTNGRAR